jgi:hypothetical protein
MTNTNRKTQAVQANQQNDGRSFKMRGFEQIKVSFRRARIVLLFLMVAALSAASMAQTAPVPTPVPWPLPAAVPPAPPKLPATQTIPTGFDVTGQIQYASLDPTPGLCNKDDNPAPTPTNPPLPDQCKTTGGWIEINNEVIRIPSSVVVIFPNTLLTWEEAFELNPNTHQTDTVFQTGLAMSDTVRFPGTYQAHVQGNIVNGQYIAGIVFMSQDPANQIMGFIEKFDYAHGVMYVNGNRIQVNDPPITFTVSDQFGQPIPDANGNPTVLTKGRYSAGQSADPRFAVDQNNTTVRAQTGYPMCIPSVSPYADGSDGSEGPSLALLNPESLQDPQCPEKNRPRDPVFTNMLKDIFTMNVPGDGPTADNPIPQDPFLEVPFEVGDFVMVIGTLEIDSAGPFMTATQVLNTSVGAYTFPGVDPAYPVIEVVIQGTGGVPAPFFPQEAGVRTRVEGFTTDPLRTIDVSAIDIDCNGNLTFREPSWTSGFPVEPGPPGIGVKGRWRMRFPQGGNFLPAVENVGARVSGSTPGKTKNGLTYSEYQLPSGEFILPENQVPGSPPPAGNFSDIQYLDNGLGPLPMVSDVFDSQQIQLFQQNSPFFPNQQLNQLSPFPDATLPPVTCLPGLHSTNAVAKFASIPNPPSAGVTVTLDASASTPAAGPFLWTQILNPGDPPVVINKANSAMATFIAPVVGGPQSLAFQLTVGDGNAIPTASTTLTVPIVPPTSGSAPVLSSAVASGTSPATPPVPVSDSSITVASSSLVTLSATGVDPSGGTLTFNWTQTGGTPVALTAAAPDGSLQTFTAPLVPIQTAVQVFTFTVTATSSVAPNSVSAPLTVTVSVAPTVDTVLVNNIVYRRTKSRLVINASDFTPGVTLTVTLDILNPATGLPWTAVMGPIIPFAQGVFSVTMSNIPIPNQITITSSGGGSTSSGVTILR